MDFKQAQREFTERVKAGLASRVLDVCQEFLSAGKRVGRWWHVGSPQNEPGDSLKIHLDGNMQGTGYFNAADQGLPPLDLWMAIRGIENFKDAVEDAAKWLGLGEPPKWEDYKDKKRPPESKGSTPVDRFNRQGGGGDRLPSGPVTAKKDFEPLKEGSPAWDYLINERGISPEVAKAYRVGEKAGGNVLCFPYYDAEGKVLLNVKYLQVEREWNDKKQRWDKKCWSVTGCDYHLFGLWLVDRAMRKREPGEREVLITEGEIDALSAASEGIAALSVPFGAKKDGDDGRENAGNRWIQNDWEWLEANLDGVVLAFDNDTDGIEGAATVVRRLPEHLIKRMASVKRAWPDAPDKADVNDLLLADPMLVHTLMDLAEEQIPPTLAQVSDWRDKIYRKMFRVEGEMDGYEVHGLGDQLRWRMGEWTIVTGYEKSGKTTWLGHQVVDLVDQGAKACIASLENQPFQTYEIMFRQALGCTRPVTLPDLKPDIPRFDRCVQWMDDRVYCYNNVGFVKLEDVLELFAYTARRFGCRIFVVDSLMMLQATLRPGQTQNDRERELAQMIKIFCDEHQCHLFLVAHAKKAQDDKGQWRKPVRVQDVRGAGELVNLAFNIINIHLNDEKLGKVRDLWEAKRMLREQRSGEYSNAELDQEQKINDELAKWEPCQDSTMFVLGQRNAEGDHPKPARRLWFHMNARQFWHEPKKEVKVYVK